MEKNFLYNRDLLTSVVPYYIGTNFDIVSISRHTDIRIESFTEEERENSNGYYAYDNVIHLKNYDVKNIVEGKDQCRDMAHEYIHLLQVSSCPIFIRESSAEVMSHEFFLNSSDFSHPYSYSKACKYLKILMEIIGPDVIMESNFKLYSEALSNSVKDYFTIDEYNEFFYILSLSPFYDVDELNNGKYDRLEELLSILYSNKFEKSILEDEMIEAIKYDTNYNRPYFNPKLIMNNSSYYISKDYINVNEVRKEEIYDCIYEKAITKEEFFNTPHQDGIIRRLNTTPLVEEVKFCNIAIGGTNGIMGEVELKNGSIIDINEAEKNGMVRINYISMKEVSIEEFLANYKTDNGYKCKIKIYVSSIEEKLENLQNEVKLS